MRRRRTIVRAGQARTPVQDGRGTTRMNDPRKPRCMNPRKVAGSVFSLKSEEWVVTGLTADKSGSRQELSPSPHVVAQVERHRRCALVIDSAGRHHGLA